MTLADKPGTGFGGEPLRLCLKCEPAHYENCPDCYGFGVERAAYDDLHLRHLPIRANDVKNPPPWKRCDNCGSTPKGPDDSHWVRE